MGRSQPLSGHPIKLPSDYSFERVMPALNAKLKADLYQNILSRSLKAVHLMLVPAIFMFDPRFSIIVEVPNHYSA